MNFITSKSFAHRVSLRDSGIALALPQSAPVVLAGGVGGRLKGGRHLAACEPGGFRGQPSAQCPVHEFDISADRFGDSTGPLAGYLSQV
jgi:hypothetical protein